MNFDPQKSLFELSTVRITLAITFIFSLTIALVIFFHSNETILLTGDGFNNTLTLYRVPLGILAVGLTLIGIYGANHRSEQTKKQIERTSQQIELTNTQIKIVEGQNLFSNFYKHIEEFIDYCHSHEGDVRFKRPRKLYNHIFEFSRKGDYTISEAFLSNFDSFINNFLLFAQGFSAADTFENALVDISILRADFVHLYGLKELETTLDGPRYPVGTGFVIIPSGNTRELFRSVIHIIESVDLALQFDIDYSPSPSFQKVKFIDLNFVPSGHLDTGYHRFDLGKFLKNAEHGTT